MELIQIQLPIRLAVAFHRFTESLLKHPSANDMDGLRRSLESMEKSLRESGMDLSPTIGWWWIRPIRSEAPSIELYLNRDDAVILCEVVMLQKGKLSRVALKLTSELVGIGGRHTKHGWKFVQTEGD